MKDFDSLIQKTAAHLMGIGNEAIKAEHPHSYVDIDNWEWPEGVGAYVLYQYYRESGKCEYKDFLINWFETKLDQGLPERNVNTTAPMLAMAFIAEEDNNQKYLDLCKDWAEWVMNDLPRTKCGGFQHIVTGFINQQQMWVDTLFMTVLFLAKAGKLFNRPDYIEESKNQFLLHIKYLFDTKTGLWFHGWTFDGNHNFANALWARGNSWYTVGVLEFIEIAEIDGVLRKYLLDTLNEQVEALARYQDKSGLWHTLIDIPDSYLETSASAGFGYGILKGVRLGVLDAKYLEMGLKALDGVVAQIDDDGILNKVSWGTGMGMDLEHYLNIPICPMAYGQIFAIMLMREGSLISR